MLDDVGLDRPPPGETFWSLLGGEGGRLQELTWGPESPEPPEATGSFVFLCHAPDMTLSQEQLAWARLGSDALSQEQLAWARLGSDAWEPPGIGSLGLVFLCLGLGWHH
jgi:hypothetical protein